MVSLDWYLRVDREHRQKAYELAWFLCPDPTTIREQIFPRAIDIALKDARSIDRAKKRTEKHWKGKIFFTRSQLFQIAVLQAAGECEETIPSATSLQCFIPYIRHLAWYTLSTNSFYVTAGFSGFLSNGSATEVLELYRKLGPGHPSSDTRDDRSVTTVRGDLRKALYDRYGAFFKTNGKELLLKEEIKTPGDTIQRILEKMIPWETYHLPNSHAQWEAAIEAAAGGEKTHLVEAARCHVSIEQAQCLDAVKDWYPARGGAFNIWRLPSLKTPCSAPSPNSWKPPDLSSWDKIERDIVKEILVSEAESRGKLGSRFEVVVDGKVETELDSEESSSVSMKLPSSTRYVEIRDKESNLMVANCHLMDPHDLPAAGWRSSVEFSSGRKINFKFSPQYDQKSQKLGISMQAQLQEDLFLIKALARFWEGLQEVVQTTPARLAVTALLLFLLTGAGITFTTLLSQFNTLVKQLHFDEPFSVRLSAVGRRSLQLDLNLHTDVVKEVYVDWGDASNPDPVGGTRIYPTEGVTVEPERLLLPPITHEYGPVPPEGLRTTVSVRIVPTALPEVRPESLSEEKLNPKRQIWLLPYGIVLDPPPVELSIVSPQPDAIVVSSMEVKVRVGAANGDLHILALDPENPKVYHYLGKIPSPPLGQEATLSHVVDIGQLGLSGPFRLIVLSTSQLEPNTDRTVAWQEVPYTVPRQEIEVRRAGVILSPTQGEIVEPVGTLRAKVFVSDTYAAALICPVGTDSCYVQNDSLTITPFTELSVRLSYGGRDTYRVYLGVTFDRGLFTAGDRFNQRPLRDNQGRPVYWIGPVEVTHE